MENGTHLTDAHKREVLDDVKHSLNPSNLTSDDILANRVTKVSSNVTQLAMASKTTADLAFSVNLIDYAADCVATHLESSDPNRELFHELVISDEVSMLSWCPGGYLMLHELTKACIPVRIGFEKFITMKDLEERTRERAEEAPKVRKRRGPNQMTKAPVVVPKKIMAPESTQNHKLNMERAQEVLADCTEREPVPFFRFVINPRSFVQTTYNIFITSFLVHEQHAVLSIGDDHELFIRRAPPSDNDENPLEDADNIQLIASLNALEWQQLVRRLDIREAMLPEFCPKVSQYFQDDQLCEELAEGVTFMDP